MNLIAADYVIKPYAEPSRERLLPDIPSQIKGKVSSQMSGGDATVARGMLLHSSLRLFTIIKQGYIHTRVPLVTGEADARSFA